MTFFGDPDERRRYLLSKLNSAADITDVLTSDLLERARSICSTEPSDQKPHRGMALLHVCATDSDVDASEPEDAGPQPAAANEKDSSSSRSVEELLPAAIEEKAIGRDEEKEQLLYQLMSADEEMDQLAVIPIVGEGGIGKTTLARLVYNDPAVREHFELKAWVNIDGQEKNQMSDIARKLLNSATGMVCHLNKLSELNEMVVDTLLSNRSLIVLDDVDTMEMELWEKMKESWFRFVGLGSKILITTRYKRVADVVSTTPSFDLRGLHRDEGWSLYSSLAFSPSKERENIRAAKMLAARCKGVPPSLRLLGSLTRFEETLLEGVSPKGVANVLETCSVISISVLALPQHLFKCFAYCGIFPCGHSLEKDKLIKMWIADDVVKEGVESLEEIGEAYFHELLCRSFFTDVICNEYGEVAKARMHSVIHKSAQQMAQVVYKEKILSIPFQQGHNPLLSFPQKNVQSLVDLKRLRSLDLSASGIDKLSKHICLLRKLRYLNLSNTPLTKLPKSFTTLTRLQTLDLSRCYDLKFLPKKMSNLFRLRHLDLSHCNSLCYIPFEIGHLNSLITMSLFVLGDKDSKCANLGELGMLRELRGVLVIRNLENVKEIGEAEAADLKGKEKIHHLGLSWSHQVDECHAVVECLEPNPNLRVLELTGYGAHRFPSWIPNLHSLVKLFINDCRCTKLPTLGQLQLLQDLELKELSNITSIGDEFYGGEGDAFPSLEKLKLHGMRSLNNWSDHSSSSRSFRRLDRLSIQDCPELRTLPSLPTVTEVVVWRSHTKILPLLAGITSLSSIVVNDVDVKETFAGMSSTSNSVKKLILVHIMDLDVLESSHVNKFASLKYLRILHCLSLEEVKFPRLGSLEKLNVVDCQKLERIDLTTEEFTLTDLIIEDCPRLRAIQITTNSGYNYSLRKLIVRNCPLFSISAQKIRELRGLKFLFLIGSCSVREEAFNDSVSSETKSLKS